MPHEAKKHLFDILEACKLIEQFSAGRTAEQYKNDPYLKSAVERQFLIIGEALQQMLKRFPDSAQRITDHRSIINFRHILAHGYDRVDDEVVWGVIETSLPILRKEVEKLLKDS